MRNDDMFIGSQFVWFTGVVEDRFDPEEMNRVRVRCFGFHTEDKGILDTENLPWATVMMPVGDSGTSGIGTTPHGLMEGSWVVGFFRDGPSAQDPIVMGTIASKSSEDNKTKGFTGLNYPRGEYVGKSDVNFSAREAEYQKGQSYLNRSDEGTKDPVQIASPAKVTSVSEDKPDSYYERKTWSELEPLNGSIPEYPYNKVYESEGGHINEIDDTPGSLRTNRQHASGTFEEIYNDGTRNVKIIGDDYEVVLSNKNIHIKGNCNMTIDGDLRQLVYGNYHLEVQNDMTLNVHGTIQRKISGNLETEIVGSRSTNVGLNDNITVVNDLTENILNDKISNIGNDSTYQITNDLGINAFNDMSLFSGGKYSQSSTGDYAVASGGNMKFGTTGNLTEDIDGTHTLSCATAALVYDAGEITVNDITQTQHIHPQTGGTVADGDANVDVGLPTG